MPQGEYMDLHRKRYGRRLDYEEKKRKREAREVTCLQAERLMICTDCSACETGACRVHQSYHRCAHASAAVGHVDAS